jgi:hypothetical protein
MIQEGEAKVIVAKDIVLELLSPNPETKFKETVSNVGMAVGRAIRYVWLVSSINKGAVLSIILMLTCMVHCKRRNCTRR